MYPCNGKGEKVTRQKSATEKIRGDRCPRAGKIQLAQQLNQNIEFAREI
jgi:hypothetical protein